MKFVKYQLILDNLNEDNFNERFGDDSFWNDIEFETKKYGIHGFGVNQRDQVVVMGEIQAISASLCTGLMSEFKAWLKNKYKTKVTENMIAKGTVPFSRTF